MNEITSGLLGRRDRVIDFFILGDATYWLKNDSVWETAELRHGVIGSSIMATRHKECTGD